MRLIAGLGNPGSQYAKTRHNAGFRVIDMLVEAFPAFTVQSDNLAHLYQAILYDQGVLLLKPQTYMNRSGIAVREILSRNQESPDSLIVVCDDLDLEVGRLRIRKKGGHGGHKGLKSIIEHLETNEFIRIRMGIGHPDSTGGAEERLLRESVVDYVLQPFHQDEQPIITAVMERAVEAVKCIVAGQIDTAMNMYNA